MKKVLTMIVAFALTAGWLAAQDDLRFTVEVSRDSVLMGNSFKVSFTLESANGGEFEPPLFEGFDILSGPNFSSSFSSINGKVSQKVSYTYYLEPRDIGNYYIEPASIAVGEQVLETMPVEVIVVPNPDGVVQEEEPGKNILEFDWNPFRWPDLPGLDAPIEPAQPEMKKKKKRKTYKL